MFSSSGPQAAVPPPPIPTPQELVAQVDKKFKENQLELKIIAACEVFLTAGVIAAGITFLMINHKFTPATNTFKIAGISTLGSLVAMPFFALIPYCLWNSKEPSKVAYSHYVKDEKTPVNDALVISNRQSLLVSLEAKLALVKRILTSDERTVASVEKNHHEEFLNMLEAIFNAENKTWFQELEQVEHANHLLENNFKDAYDLMQSLRAEVPIYSKPCDPLNEH